MASIPLRGAGWPATRQRSRAIRAWLTAFALLGLMAFAGLPRTAFAQADCQDLQGKERAQCLRDAALVRRRAAHDAWLIKQKEEADARKVRLEASQGLNGYAERPVLIEGSNPPTMTVVVHSPYSGRDGNEKIRVTRECTGYPGDELLTYTRACKVQILQSPAAALPLFKQACDEGDPSGCRMLAMSMTSKESRAGAVALFKWSCDLEEQYSCYEVAEAYRTGNGVAKDTAQTHDFYERACSFGNVYSCAWMAGKIDPACPHGHRVYYADLNKNVYKVMCETSTSMFGVSKEELPASAEELKFMKQYGAQMKNAPTIDLSKAIRDALLNGGSSAPDTLDPNDTLRHQHPNAEPQRQPDAPTGGFYGNCHGGAAYGC